jgi:UDP-GlcNAc:undecaprenyl-phosphate GlcNAc-1-phosphate transferase
MQISHLIVVSLALALSLIFTPLILNFSHRHEWYDEKNHRKVHTRDIPRLGGVGIFVAFLPALIIGMSIVSNGTFADRLTAYLPAILGLVLIHLTGLIDDFRNLRAAIKLVAQLAAAFLVTLSPLRITVLWIPLLETHLSLGLFAYPVSVLWIVAVANAVNLIDGTDGLAGGFSAIAVLATGLIGLFVLGNPTLAIIAFALFGALLGFLFFNFPPARIFMGDSGSLTVGFLLAAIPLASALEAGASGPVDGFGMIPIVTILLLPILDMITAIARRLRKGQPIHMADREHVHHKLIDRGFSARAILAVLYSYTAVTGLSAVAWFLLPPALGVSSVAVVWLGSLGIVLFLDGERRKARRNAGAQ